MRVIKRGLFGPRPIRWAQSNPESIRSGSTYLVLCGAAAALALNVGFDAAWTSSLSCIVAAGSVLWAVIWITLSREAGLYQRADKRFGTDLLGDPKRALAIIEAKLQESADTVRDAYTWWLAGTWSQDSRDGAVANYDELAQLAWQIAEIPIQPWDKLSPPKKESKVRSLPIAEAS